jgi:predicted ATP-binding protein involved in virulence
MIKPEDFPYIKSLHVNDCYAYKDFDIVLHEYKPFSHLILTGKNGSGKSTILRTINYHISVWRGSAKNTFIFDINNVESLIGQYKIQIKNEKSREGAESQRAKEWQQKLDLLDRVNINYLVQNSAIWSQSKGYIVYSFLQAKREIPDKIEVRTVTKETDFTSKLLGDDSKINFVKEFKQYLVNQKVHQAFNQLNNNKTKIEQIENFFINLTKTFRRVFDDYELELIFIQENFEFYIKLSDGRQLTFDTLSEGFSALLSILMDLFLRVDLIRKQVGDFSYNPCGIVLIDEPETHLHLELQYQVLPLLIELFPNIQFIAATHSPAVISSIKKATIYDLTTKILETDDVAGKSYSELMVTHFGLENEYSNIADTIIDKVNAALKKLGDNPEALKRELQSIFDENSNYLSPTLKVELELLIAQQEVKYATK